MSGELGSVWLCNGNRVVEKKFSSTQKSHSSAIHPFVDELMLNNELTFKDLSALCVLNGPGSYTGLRLALATAKGICYAASIPLITLHAFDLAISNLSSIQSDIVVIAQARVGEYIARYYKQSTTNSIEELLINTERVIDFILNPNIQLYACNTPVLIDNHPIKTINISDELIVSFCNKRILSATHDDLLKAEPFYMKEVYLATKKSI
jgi:Inactive homolog of metal-dependent proteases, putative molecular chaperone